MPEVETIPLDALVSRVETFLRLAEVLASKRPSRLDGCTDELRLVEGALLKNISRLNAIHHLFGSEGEDFSGPATEIMRNMLEDNITLEYIYARPQRTNGLIKRFFDFRWVQLQRDANFYKSVDALQGERHLAIADEIRARCDKSVAAYPDPNKGFVDRDGNLHHSWIRRSVPDLIKSLDSKKVWPSDKIEVVANAYVEGSRETHFNPHNILTKLGDEPLHGSSPDVNIYNAYIFGTLALIDIVRRYTSVTSPALHWADMASMVEAKCDDMEEDFTYFHNNITAIG